MIVTRFKPDFIGTPLYYVRRDEGHGLVESRDLSRLGAPRGQFVAVCFLVSHVDWMILEVAVIVKNCRVTPQNCPRGSTRAATNQVLYPSNTAMKQLRSVQRQRAAQSTEGENVTLTRVLSHQGRGIRGGRDCHGLRPRNDFVGLPRSLRSLAMTKKDSDTVSKDKG